MKSFFERQGIGTVAIYGMAMTGTAFKKCLEDCEVKICRNKSLVDGSLEIRTAEQVEADMDMIIVAAESDYEAIKDGLNKIIDVPVASLSNLLQEVMLSPVAVEI